MSDIGGGGGFTTTFNVIRQRDGCPAALGERILGLEVVCPLFGSWGTIGGYLYFGKAFAGQVVSHTFGGAGATIFSFAFGGFYVNWENYNIVFAPSWGNETNSFACGVTRVYVGGTCGYFTGCLKYNIVVYQTVIVTNFLGWAFTVVFGGKGYRPPFGCFGTFYLTFLLG